MIGRSYPILLLACLWIGPASAAPLDGADLNALKRDARSRDIIKRTSAYQALLDHGEAGRKILVEAVREKEKKDLERLLDLPGSREAANFKKWLRNEIPPLQEAALAIIRDRKLYPDDAHGEVGQHLVDEKVDALRKLWETPGRLFQERESVVNEILGDLDEDIRYLKLAGEEPREVTSKDEALHALDKAFDLNELTASRSAVKRDREVLEYNEDVLTSATDEELEFVRILNEYRLMLGLNALAIDERLMQAARKHSQEMMDLDYFSHVSPVKKNESARDRAANEGYNGSVGENCAIADGAQGAFDGWYSSSGHHRALIGSFDVIGAGHSVKADGTPGRQWTMNPGRGDSLMNKRRPDPKEVFLARRARLKEGDVDGRMKLATWCRKKSLQGEAQEILLEVVAIQPQNEKARRLLGHVEVGGQWLTREESLLAQIKTLPADKALKEILAVLKSSDDSDREAAAAALSHLDRGLAGPQLVRCLKDSASEVRIAALDGLGTIGDANAIGAIRPLLEDQSLYVRHAAVRALFRSGDTSGVPVLFQELRSKDLNTRINAHRIGLEILGNDFGFRWDLPDERRAEVVDEWEAWWKGRSEAANQ